MRIGVDLGGTKIEAIALNANGDELLRERINTPKGSYSHIVQAIVQIVTSVETRLGCQGSIGVGIPGTISTTTGLVKNANTLELNGKPLDFDLASALQRPVRIANDANCFALSEASDGAGAGGQVVFGVILGTGCGGGIVVDGKILTGINSIAGEWGHNRLPDRGPDEIPGLDCYCGHRGCNETFISGTGMERDYERLVGQRLSARQIVQLADNGNEAALEIVTRLARRIGRALAVVINILDPDVIVLGGGVSNINRLYGMVPEFWTPYVFSDHVETRLAKAIHGDSSGVRGAAWLWPVA